MTETLLAKLSSRLESASTAEEKGLASAKYAIALAQMGQIDGATQILERLRANRDYICIPRVSIEIILLDGIVLYYSSRSPMSLDRVRRANLLSRSLRMKDLEAATSVWIVHLAFNFDDYELLSDGLAVGFEYISLLSDELCGRLCLSVADAVQYVGNREASTAWYGMARLFAQRTHDHAMMAAIEHNRLAMGLSRLRVESYLTSSAVSDEHRHWLAEMGSIERLHYGLGAGALSELLSLCESRARELENDFPGALEVLGRIRDNAWAEKCGMSTQLLDLEMLWCQAMGHAFNEASMSQLPTLSEIKCLSNDEQLVALNLLRDIVMKVGGGLDEELFVEMLQRAVSDCKESIAAIERCFAPSVLDIQVMRNEFTKRTSLA